MSHEILLRQGAAALNLTRLFGGLKHAKASGGIGSAEITDESLFFGREFGGGIVQAEEEDSRDGAKCIRKRLRLLDPHATDALLVIADPRLREGIASSFGQLSQAKPLGLAGALQPLADRVVQLIRIHNRNRSKFDGIEDRPAA